MKSALAQGSHKTCFVAGSWKTEEKLGSVTPSMASAGDKAGGGTQWCSAVPTESSSLHRLLPGTIRVILPLEDLLEELLEISALFHRATEDQI